MQRPFAPPVDPPADPEIPQAPAPHAVTHNRIESPGLFSSTPTSPEPTSHFAEPAEVRPQSAFLPPKTTVEAAPPKIPAPQFAEVDAGPFLDQVDELHPMGCAPAPAVPMSIFADESDSDCDFAEASANTDQIASADRAPDANVLERTVAETGSDGATESGAVDSGSGCTSPVEPQAWDELTPESHSYEGVLQVADAEIGTTEVAPVESLALQDEQATPENFQEHEDELDRLASERGPAVSRTNALPGKAMVRGADPTKNADRLARMPATREEEAVFEPDEPNEAPKPVLPVADAPVEGLTTTLGELKPEASGAEELLHYASVTDTGPVRGGFLTIPLMCLGLGLLACCILVPLCDSNRRAAYERLRLRRDLATLQRQVATNEQFLRKVVDDPVLAERLAQRQLHKIRIGTRVLPMMDYGNTSDRPGNATPMSPFQIVAVPPPAPLPAYQPIGGKFAGLCSSPRSRLYVIGGGLMLVAAGLVLGYTPRPIE